MGTAQYTTNEARLALLPKRFQNPSDVVPKVGDIAAVTLDKNGEIVEYKILANVNEYPDKVYTERTIGANMQWGYDFSFITKVNATTFSVGIKNSQQICYDTPGRADIQGTELSLSVPAYKWNFEKQCFETISMPKFMLPIRRFLKSAPRLGTM